MQAFGAPTVDMPGKKEYVVRLSEGKFQDVKFDADWLTGNGENVEYTPAAGAATITTEKMAYWKGEGIRYVTGLNTNVVESSTQVDMGSTKSFATTNAFQKDRSVAANVEGSYGLAEASVSMAVAESVSSSISRSSVVSERVFQESLYSITLKTDRTQYENAFRDYMVRGDDTYLDGCYDGDDPPEDGSGCKKFKSAFIEKYGTHVITKVTMGGRVTTKTETSACLQEDERSLAVESEVCSKVTKVVGQVEGCVSGATSDSESSSSESEIKSWSLTTEGGSDDICTKDGCEFDKYEASVTDRTGEVISVELTSIKYFIDNDRPHVNGRSFYAYCSQLSLWEDQMKNFISSQKKPNCASTCDGAEVCESSPAPTLSKSISMVLALVAPLALLATRFY